MHGRLKVKTSEQQAAEKRAVRNEKMKIYRGAMSALLTHRLQHNEGQLKMTSGLLQANPDITTLWNIRKEALLHLLEERYNPVLRK
jgi:geranylgeranyl transferase type-2 subunit alpha